MPFPGDSAPESGARRACPAYPVDFCRTEGRPLIRHGLRRDTFPPVGRRWGARKNRPGLRPGRSLTPEPGGASLFRGAAASAAQLPDSRLGGHLLGLLFAAALPAAHRGAVQVHLHKKALVVVRTLLAHQLVGQHLPALPLDQLLEGGL